MEHTFTGKWITDREFYQLEPRNVFSRQLERVTLSCEEHRNRHILFRRKFSCGASLENATLFISADDYYKLYINGQFVAQGPAPSYHFQYHYNAIDVSRYLQEGENLIAVRTANNIAELLELPPYRNEAPLLSAFHAAFLRPRKASVPGWGKDTKWNTSLFHLTMSYAATFMADLDLKKLFA